MNMSALDLMVMIHTTKCNFALLKGEKCICGSNEAADELSALRSEIERLKAEREWQPIKTFDKSTENENIDYLFLEKGVISIGFRYPDGFTDTLAVDVLWPDHYMKLPQPPEEK